MDTNANEVTAPVVDRPTGDRQIVQPDLGSGCLRLDHRSAKHSITRPAGYTARVAVLVAGCLLVLAMLVNTVL